ncbi:preprotein translocase subunit SecA [Mycoplasma phocimorsus]|uniref:preprotein translocase subunit SecA n=1 Tax=Mycoplasma phocimorsus TaxID=3045839 RepID=UPI0030157363
MSIKSFFNKLFKSTDMRIAEKTLEQINKEWAKISLLSDEELKNKTLEFKERHKHGEKLESMRAEVFAVSKEATKRVLNKTPFDVQMIGGVLLDLGSVAEMKTGEGKTITSIAPIYLNALSSKGVIVSTVNEYLAERDATELGAVFNFLGLTVGINKTKMSNEQKRAAYAADITYSIHSELGFDYLKDNMVENIDEKVQRGLNYCLIDEVDSILIDEAKTPLIISGGESNDAGTYEQADQFVRMLDEEDYEMDEESRAVVLTHRGIAKANKFYRFENLYDFHNSETVHRIQNALRAHKSMFNNVEYIVRDGKIELVDAFTGRIMDGRAYSEGLQQALQAKERLEIEPETKTLATITYQNFFRMFNKLCGMTGTAKTEEQEFIDIYNMRVNVVPTNKPIIRDDQKDIIFATAHAKWKAVAQKIQELHAIGQPILVGTAQIEDSEYIHEMLEDLGVPHTVLNAKQDKSEADIIAEAGIKNAVTIATNMAGRGTDIKLTDESKQLGGLFVIGTDKAESRRIDNQLRGRSGRQGDPGTSVFYISLEDQLIKRFANPDEFKRGYEDQGDNAINDPSLRLLVNMAQKKIEGFNYDIRKTVLNYDDVIRQQRNLMYAQRDVIISNIDDFKKNPIIERMINFALPHISKAVRFVNSSGIFMYDEFVNFVNEEMLNKINLKLTVEDIIHIPTQKFDEALGKKFNSFYDIIAHKIIENYGADFLYSLEKRTIISILDDKWKNHINQMDRLRSNINLVQYAQKNPYQEYTRQGGKMFDNMISDIAVDSIFSLFNSQYANEIEIPSNYLDDEDFVKIMEEFTFVDEPKYHRIKKWIEIFEQRQFEKEISAKKAEVLEQILPYKDNEEFSKDINEIIDAIESEDENKFIEIYNRVEPLLALIKNKQEIEKIKQDQMKDELLKSNIVETQLTSEQPYEIDSIEEENKVATETNNSSEEIEQSEKESENTNFLENLFSENNEEFTFKGLFDFLENEDEKENEENELSISEKKANIELIKSLFQEHFSKALEKAFKEINEEEKQEAEELKVDSKQKKNTSKKTKIKSDSKTESSNK